MQKYIINKKFLNINKSSLALITLGLFFLSYIILKAKYMSITYDEAFTYLIYVKLDIHSILLSRGPSPANNHLLNTLFIKLLAIFHTPSTFIIRIPNIIAYIIYIISSSTLLLKLKKLEITIPGFILLNTNPFVIEFFSIARGYGLALGFLSLEILFLYNWLQNKYKNKFFILMLLSGILSVLSNLAYLNTFLAITFTIELFLLCREFSQKKDFLKQLFRFIYKSIPVFISYLLLGLILYKPILFMRKTKQFYFGGTHSFIEDTIGSLVTYSLYHQNYFINQKQAIINLIGIMTGFLFSLFIFLLYKLNKTKTLSKTHEKFYISLIIILFLSAFSTIVQHYILNTKYLIRRTALFYIYIFLLALIFAIKITHHYWNKKYIYKLGLALLLILTIFSLLHFSNTISIKTTYTWQHNADNNDLIIYLAQKKENALLYSYWIQSKPLEYYLTLYNIQTIHYQPLHKIPDVLSCTSQYSKITCYFWGTKHPQNCTPLKYYKKSKQTLYLCN